MHLHLLSGFQGQGHRAMAIEIEHTARELLKEFEHECTWILPTLESVFQGHSHWLLSNAIWFVNVMALDLHYTQH